MKRKIKNKNKQSKRKKKEERPDSIIEQVKNQIKKRGR